MKKQRHSSLFVLKKLLEVCLIAAIFLIPLFLTVRWTGQVAGNRDPRQVFEVERQTAQFQTLRPFEEPLITVTFDDGWESIYSQGLPILQKYNVRTTQYVLSGEFEEYVYMSEAQVRSFIEAGHDIGSHTVTHKNLTTLTPTLISEEVTGSYTELNRLFGEVEDFASPHSAFNDEVISEVKKNYRSHRNTYGDVSVVDENDVNVRSNFDIYSIIAYTVTKDTTTDDLQKLLDYAKATNGWVVLCYHQIDASNTFYSVNPEAFDEQMRFLSRSGVSIPTMDEVLDVIERRRP